MRILFTLLLFPLTTLLCAQVKDTTTFRPKLYVYAGSFFPTINTTLRVDSDVAGIGSLLSLEDNLKLDEEKTTVRLDAYWDITRRSGICGSFFYLNRGSTILLDEDIKFKDSTYHLGETIHLWFNTGFFSLGYRYSIFAQENWNAGLSTGINWLQVGTGIDVVGNKNYAGSIKFPAPTPFLGLHIQGNLNSRMRARYDFRYFGLTIQGISGRVFENKMMMEYYVFKNVGIGAAFNIIGYHIQEIPFVNNFQGNMRFGVNGFSLYLATRF